MVSHDHLVAFIFAIVLTVMIVGAIATLLVLIGVWTWLFIGGYIFGGLYLLLRGRDGPGGMPNPHHEGER